MEYGLEDFWYGMEENCQYGIWKNRLPFHSIPCPAGRVEILRPAGQAGWKTGGILLSGN